MSIRLLALPDDNVDALRVNFRLFSFGQSGQA
jgi:hypothetical protein